jgi:thioredoxin 1
MQDWTPADLEKHLESGEKVFLKLWKRGCGACKLSTPALERIEAADELGLTFAQINVDDHPELLEIAETDVLPAFFIFKDKQMANKLVGFKGLEKLKSMILETFK